MLNTRYYSYKKQYLIVLIIQIINTLLCYTISDFVGYKGVALIFLMQVSLNAILFDIFPVLLSAIFSALTWNFFFINPILTFHINEPDDALLFLLFFVIASINAVLTYKIKGFERKQSLQEEKNKTIELYNTVLNSLSHELKTPIATIIGAVDTIKNKNQTLSDTNLEILYNEIEKAGLRLNQQVKNLLNMSRLESGFIQIKNDWIDINELIYKIIHQNKENSTTHTITFEPKNDFPLCKLDAGLLEQIIHNIIHNALTYTPIKSTITIEVNYEKDTCIIVITDNGHGFPADEIEFVFDKFYRLKNSYTGGTGLGLSIVKGYLKAMNGSVTLSNLTQNGGAKFILKIPCEISNINLNNPTYA